MSTLDELRVSAALPSLPYVGHEILLAVYASEPEPGRIAALIQRDPAVTVRVLAAANSAYFRGGQTIYSVSEAILRLGLARVGQLVTLLLLADRFDPARCPAFDVAAYWRRTMAGATLAARLAQHLPVAEGISAARLAAMLQEIGLLLLVQCFPEDMQAVCRGAGGDRQLAVRMERERLGFDRYQAGAMLLDAWELPPLLAATVAAFGRGEQPGPGWTLLRVLQAGTAWLDGDLETPPPDLQGADGLTEDVLAQVRDALRAEARFFDAMARMMSA